MPASEAERPIMPDPSRFYDGGVDAVEGQVEVQPIPGSEARIELVRCTVDGRERFAMQRRIAYNDRIFHQLLVPRETRTFRSDLTSVPALFTWLVPKTGEHLPATLLHDGLIHPPGDQTYSSANGTEVRRVEADRVLRDAMADSRTALIRRWLIWSAVTIATMFEGTGTGWSKSREWYYRLVVIGTFLLIVKLGVCASLDVLDVEIPYNPTHFWMGERPWHAELVGGLSGAVVIPLVLALLWGRFRIAGAIVGVSLAVLLPVTVALGIITALYQGLEWCTKKMPRAAIGLAIVGMSAALGVFVAVLWTR